MSKELIEFSQDQKKLIMKQFFPPQTTPDEMKYCMGVAGALGLNPITKEIFFVKRRAQIDEQWVTKIEPLAGRDAFLKIAHRSGVFAGIETTAEVRKMPKLENDEWVEKSELVATCRVYRKDVERPFVVEVEYSEYLQLTKEGKPTKFWAEKPSTMLKKVAESQALRKAFNISGIYVEEEVSDSAVQTSHREVEIETEIQDDPIEQIEQQEIVDINEI